MQYGEVSFRQVLGSRHGLVAWLLLGLALLITLVLWQFSVLLVEDRTRVRFENQSRQLKTAIEERLLNYEQVLAGAAGLFAVADLVGREGWRTYVKRLDIERYYPGIQGIGYTERVADQDVSRHIERVREQGLPDYLISPAGTRTEYHPVVYLEPSTRRNRRAYGYDAFGDPAHRDAMERARDSGMATMTGRVVLVQEVGDDEQPGFLMYFPVYAGDRVPEYLADRRLALRGYVFSAFRMNNLMDAIVGLIAPFLDVHIYDSDVVVNDAQMYASNLGSLDDVYSFEMHQTVEHGGRTWLLVTRSTPAFDYLASDPRPSIVLGAGGIISLLIWIAALALVRSRLLAQTSAGRYRAITEGASDLTLILSRQAAIRYASPSCARVLGEDAHLLLGQSLAQRVHPDDWPQFLGGLDEAAALPGRTLSVVRARVRDQQGGWRDMEGSCTAMFDVPGVQGVVVSLRDLTELKAAQAELHKLAYYDPLTGLANRQLFRQRLEHAVRAYREDGSGAALLFLDLDGFKQINDSLGHDAGDKLLAQIGQWLNGCVREEDAVARLGGDEFTVLLTQVSGTDAVLRVAEVVLRRLSQRMRLGEHEVGVTASIGIAMLPGDSDDASTLMKFADLAMYRAKELGRNTIQFFAPSMNIQASRRLLQQEELRAAYEAGQFLLHYQPKIELPSRRVVGVEALLRWRHPERGLVPAQHFIALAEECGLIVRLGEMALHLACHQLDVLRRAGFTDLRMAVNLSPRQIAEPRFLSRLQEILNDTRVDPGMLDLELSPAILSGPEEPLQGLLMTLRSLGVHLVLDDFGAGPTSLVGLQSLPLAAVKIDQRFIRDIPYDPGATDVTSAVIALAQCLRLKVIAEGVETPEQVDFLIAQRCTQAQGNLFCQGLDGDALMAFLERHRARA